MPVIATWSNRRIAVISAAWLLLMLTAYWPLWYEAQLWWVNHRPEPAGGMRMTYLDIDVMPTEADGLIWLLLVLLVPAVLLRVRNRQRRSGALAAT